MSKKPKFRRGQVVKYREVPPNDSSLNGTLCLVVDVYEDGCYSVAFGGKYGIRRDMDAKELRPLTKRERGDK